jgi:hypothetical protein
MRKALATLILCSAMAGTLWADDHGSSPLTATPVAVGSGLVSGCLEVGGDMDYFFFQATAGRTYQLLTSHLDGGADTVLYLLDPDGVSILAVDDDGGTDGGSRIEWAAPSSATYFAMVRHAQATTGTGCYAFSVSALQVDDHGNDSLTASPISVGGSLSGFHETPEDVDAFLFAAEAGYVYGITLEKTSGEGTARLDLLVGETTAVLATATANGGAARVTWSATRTGAQFLAVCAEGGTGGYRISIVKEGYDDDFPNSAATAVDLVALGATAIGRLEVSEDSDWFRFRARKAGDYRLVLDADGPIRMTLVGLDGETILEEMATAAGDGLALNWSAPSEGAYFVELASISGNVAYTLHLEATLQLEFLGQFNTSGYSLDVAASGSYAYLIVGTQGLLVVDVSDPSAPIEVGSHSTRGYAQAVALAGHYAYVANRSEGLTVLDVSDPMRPAEVGFLDTVGSAWDVAVSGGRAFVADYSQGGLQIVDVSHPSSPSLMSTYATAASAKAVCVADGIAYVAMGDAGLELVDVSVPAAPAKLAVAKTFGEANGVAVSNGIAYVASGYGGIRLLDVANPAAPAEIGFIPTSAEAMGVSLVGGVLYVAEATSGLSVYSVTDPANPRRIAQFDTPGEATRVAVDGERAYVADREEGLQIVGLLQ